MGEYYREPNSAQIALQADHPMVIYTDACGDGQIGGMIVHRGVQYFSHSHLPGWLDACAGIYEFELAAALACICIAIELAHGEQLVV